MWFVAVVLVMVVYTVPVTLHSSQTDSHLNLNQRDGKVRLTHAERARGCRTGDPLGWMGLSWI